jgi:hypothetical protein
MICATCGEPDIAGPCPTNDRRNRLAGLQAAVADLERAIGRRR